MLRIQREADEVPRYLRRRQPERPRPQARASRPNDVWDYDLTEFPTLAGDYHLIPVLDRCSRKNYRALLRPGGHLGCGADRLEQGPGRRGPVCRGGPGAPVRPLGPRDPDDLALDRLVLRDLGNAQTFSRPRTPTDNATCEFWMATLKCERLYGADTVDCTPTRWRR